MTLFQLINGNYPIGAFVGKVVGRVYSVVGKDLEKERNKIDTCRRIGKWKDCEELGLINDWRGQSLLQGWSLSEIGEVWWYAEWYASNIDSV